MNELAQQVELSQLLLELAPQILEVLNDALVVTDEQGRIVLFNRRAELLLGYHRSELIGQRVEILIPEGARERHLGHTESYQADPRPRPMGVGMNLHARKKSGAEVPVEISLGPLPTPRGIFVVTLIRAHPNVNPLQLSWGH